jgi:DNA-binding FrmR family transcriptional regulator
MKRTRTSVLTTLKKARSSLDKIIQMIEQDAYCVDIIQQNLAVNGLLKSVNLQLLEDHLGCCFVNAIKSEDEKRQEEMIQEILMIIKIAQNK